MTVDWLLWLFMGAAIVAATVGVIRRLILRYHACTFRDSNPPHGRETDWRMFFLGRRRR